MSLLTEQELKDIGFIPEGFGNITDFDAFLKAIINKQEALLSKRIGATTFEDASLAEEVKDASLSLCAAELIQRRINRLTLNLDADTAGIMSQLRKSKQDYLSAAEPVINKLITSPGQTETGSYSADVVEYDSSASGVRPAWPVNGVA